MVAGFVHGADSVDRRHAAGEDPRGDAAFECGEIFFQAIARGIRDARIFVSFVFADFLLNIGGRRINWRRNGAGFRIRLLTSVNGASGKTVELLFGHGFVELIGQNNLLLISLLSFARAWTAEARLVRYVQ